MKMISLEKLEQYRGVYLEGGAVTAFLDECNIKFAAGHWTAGDFIDRFATGGYQDKTSFSSELEAQIERVAQAGVRGIEFHDHCFRRSDRSVDMGKLASIRANLKDRGMVPTNMNNNLWTDPRWKFGGISNPDPSIRKAALESVKESIEMAKELGCASVSLWPGSDGWDYNFEVDYGLLIDHFIEGAIEINTAAKNNSLIFGVEAKLHEPREGNLVIPTTHTAAFIAKIVNESCGGTNMGVCIDYGHEQMYAVEPAFTVHFLKKTGIPLVNFHINTAKLHSNDEDRICGTGDLWRMIDFCHAAAATGYDGWYGEDQFTYRQDPVYAIAISMELFANCMKKALFILAEEKKISEFQEKNQFENVLDTVKKIVYNG
ncbi:MAG: sugar phosphate isomerase/epimerase family protein [Candidatus Ratteibacteria bacterium]